MSQLKDTSVIVDIIIVKLGQWCQCLP